MFVGVDPQDLRKKQTFPISKTLLLKQFDFLQSNSKAHQEAICRKADVEEWIDGETPEVFQKTFVDAPVEELDEEEVEELAGRADSNKYRGPVASTLGAQELMEALKMFQCLISVQTPCLWRKALAGKWLLPSWKKWKN